MNALSTLCSVAAAAFRPEPLLTVSEWADNYRQVGKPSPEPGQWRTSRVPYLREIMDRLTPADPCEIVVVEKAAQMALTECLLNALGCFMHRYPDNGMLVLPTTKTAKQFVRTRLDPLVDSNPVLKEIIAPVRNRIRSNTVALKEFQGALLAIVGANSGNDLRSYPGRYALMDEVDGYPPDLDYEGDPTELVIQRTAAFAKRKILMISTPTLLHTSIIHKWFMKGDQRHYHVPCPLCNWFQALVWGTERIKQGALGGLRWDSNDPETARYQCEKCGKSWEEYRKLEVLPHGEWIAAAPDNYRENAVAIRSHHINALYGPYGWPGNKWVNLAAQWITDHKDPIKLKTFINLKLGEPYADPVEARADANTLLTRRESYGPDVPAGACVLTAGVDVQADRLECELVAWGPGEESWSLDYRVFPGDTSKITSTCWSELDYYLGATYTHELGIALSVKAACVDSGYNRQTVSQWCNERAARRIWPTLGRAGNFPIWDSKWKKAKGKYGLGRIVGVDAAKEVIYAALRLTEPGPRYCHFPLSLSHDAHYFDMLVSEVRVPDYTGPIPKYIWKKREAGIRNEALDCRVGAYTALLGLTLSYGVRLTSELAAIRRAVDSGKRPEDKLQRPPSPVPAIHPDPTLTAYSQPSPARPSSASKHVAAVYSSDPWL